MGAVLVRCRMSTIIGGTCADVRCAGRFADPDVIPRNDRLFGFIAHYSVSVREKVRGRVRKVLDCVVSGKAAMTMTGLGSALVLVGLAVGAYQFITGKWKPVRRELP